LYFFHFDLLILVVCDPDCSGRGLPDRESGGSVTPQSFALTEFLSEFVD